VGRTANNDIVLPLPSISKFHAYFRLQPDRVELNDAGSSNGTFIGALRLASKGEPGIVVSGDILRFADIRMLFVSAGECWDWARNPTAP
jgi:pSer/pThr/pTyr-binding forkhead associated (FHA) protein